MSNEVAEGSATFLEKKDEKANQEKREYDQPWSNLQGPAPSVGLSLSRAIQLRIRPKPYSLLAMGEWREHYYEEFSKAL